MALGHGGDDVGLGDGLAVTDRERPVVVGIAAGALRDEAVALHGPHGPQRGRVGHAPRRDLGGDHGFTRMCVPCVLGNGGGGDEKQGKGEKRIESLHGNLPFPAGKAGQRGPDRRK